MKQLLCITGIGFALSGCGMIDMPSKMDKTNENMQRMIDGMDHTNGGIDKQSKLIPFENMLKTENAENLSPIPTRLIPFGKELALVITADDMVELTYLWLKEVDELFPAHTLNAQGEPLAYTPDQIEKINHEKMARLVGLQIIAGYLPQERVNEIIQKQVYTGGRHEDVVYSLLMLRAQFIRDILLDASLLAAPLNNAGKVAQAVEYNRSIDFIAKLKFVGKIGLKTKGFIPAETSPIETFDTELALKNWLRIQRSAERDCQIRQQGVESLTGDEAHDQKIHQNKLSIYNQALETIMVYINSWPRQ